MRLLSMDVYCRNSNVKLLRSLFMKRFVGMLARASFLAALLLSFFFLSGFHSWGQAHAANAPAPQATGRQLAVASLAHVAHGSAQLDWSPVSDSLTVTLYVSGLQANTVHPAHIHTGNCLSDGAIIYPLTNVVANAAGNAVSRTVISGVKGGIPATGWYINVHVGPTISTPAQGAAVTCGNIANSNTSVAAAQSVTTTLGVTPSPNQNAYGLTFLALKGSTLTVYTTVYHLVPGSSHAAHIHLGSCEYQTPGSVLYPLTTLTANDRGVARSVTTINGVGAIPAAGWYVNIHGGTDLSTQTGFDPIACGNVTSIY
jgi:hypothetical protein